MGDINSSGNGVFGNSTGQVSITPDVNGGIEIGNIGRATAGTPFIDFHSSNFGVDYDVRLIASGGSGTNGSGNLDTFTYNFNASGNFNVVSGIISGDGYGISNIAGANITGTVANATNANSVVNGTSSVTIPTTDGNVITTSNGNTTLTVTDTGANITGYANITGNLIAGNTDFTSAANVSLGNIANLHITGGTANQVLSTDGSGTLTFKTGSITVVGRSGNISIPIILS